MGPPDNIYGNFSFRRGTDDPLIYSTFRLFAYRYSFDKKPTINVIFEGWERVAGLRVHHGDNLDLTPENLTELRDTCDKILKGIAAEKNSAAEYGTQESRDAADEEELRRYERVKLEAERSASLPESALRHSMRELVFAVYSAVDNVDKVPDNLSPVDVITKYLQRGNIQKDGDW